VNVVCTPPGFSIAEQREYSYIANRAILSVTACCACHKDATDKQHSLGPGSITAQPILDRSASCAGDERNPREHRRIQVESGLFILRTSFNYIMELTRTRSPIFAPP